MTPISTPSRVTRVVVMEDRAQVERAATLTVPAGRHQVSLDGVTALAVDRSLKVSVAGASFIDAKLVRTWKEQPKGGVPADASELRRRVKALEDEALARTDASSRASARVQVLQKAGEDLQRAIAEHAAVGKADPSDWRAQTDALAQAQTEAAEALRAARRDEGQTARRMSEAQSALAIAERREEAVACSLVVTVEGAGGEISVTASHLVPCAVWRPAYRATQKEGAVLLEAEAVVWQRTGEDWKDVSVALSTARPTLGTTPPSLSEDWLSTRPKEAEEKKVVSVSLREVDIQTAGETSSDDAEFPGLDDGGEARLLEVAHPATIESDGHPHRLRLFSFESRAEFERLCVPERSPLVSLVARFANAGPQVLLAGPVDLLRHSGFVGRSQLRFTAVGETMKLSFGSEDGVRVDRTVDSTQEEARITGRRTTRRLIQLHVSNASRTPARLVIEERVPVSEVKEVEITVLKEQCTPAPQSVSKEGIARLELELEADATARATFAWELSASSKVAGV